MQEGLKELETLLDPYDWFYEVEAEARRYVVYVNYMCSEQDTIIPDMVQGRQVVVHFTSAKTGSAQDYMAEDKKTFTYHQFPFLTPDSSGSITQEDLEAGLKELSAPNETILVQELTRLEKQVGPNILFDIFFEIHDGKNAVTTLGSKFPETHEGMKRLYDDYGFDPIYNELEG